MKPNTINEYLVNNPDKISMVFTKVFGKYLIRYYEKADKYTIIFDDYEDTSYEDRRNQKICIALRNVVDLLERDLPVMSIAYHELSHVLYTNNTKRNNIIDKAYEVSQSKGWDFDQRTAQNIWNVLEDEYIERRLAKEYPFLKNTIEPLRTLIPDDGKLMKWRSGKQGAPQDIVERAEKFAKKRLTNKESGEIIAYIMWHYYFNDNDKLENRVEGSYEQENEDGEKEKVEAQESSNEKSENDNNDNNQESEESEEQEDSQEEDSQEDSQEEDSEELQANRGYDTQTEEEEIGNLKAYKKDKAIKSMLLDYEKEKQRQELDRQLKRATITKKKVKIENYHEKIKTFYNAKHYIRGGMTQAQQKGYTMNLSNRVSVNKIIESKATKQPPKVFYGKGKDIDFMKKVVILEDISASTHGFSGLLSNIAKTLADAFEQSEWWAYGRYLYQKQKEEYKYKTMRPVYEMEGNFGSGTRTDYLLSFMKKHQNEDNIYVIITDGDMDRFFMDKVQSKFLNKMAVVGVLDETIRENAPYHCDIGKDIEKLSHDYFTHRIDELEHKKEYQQMIVKSVQSVIQIIKERVS